MADRAAGRATANPSSRAAAPAGRRHALIQLLREAARLDRTQSDPVVAARNAVGVALPLAIGALAGNTALGLPSTIGALQTAFADRPGPYRLRMLRMAATAFAAAVTSTLAVALSRNDVASALLLLVVGFVAGLLLTAGPSGAQVGIAATAAALVLGHQAQRPAAAVHVGLLVLAGGAIQIVLAIAAWPLRRHLPERRALGGLYRKLADLARQPPGTDVGPPLGETLADVRQMLYGLGHDHGPSVEAYRVLLDEAERIRRQLLVLGGYVERLAREDAGPATAAVRSVLEDTATVLDEVAAALVEGRQVREDVLAPVRARTHDVLGLLGDPATAGSELTRRAAAAQVRHLTGQLRAALDTARTGASEGRQGEDPDDVHGLRRLRDAMATLRANLTPGSAVLRHAVRVGVLVAVSDLVVRLAGFDRGYWIPLTIMVVLRPDFASTFQRSSMRVVGTIIGLLIATVLVHWVPGGRWYSVALVALFFFGMRLAGPGNLGLSAMALAALVVVLLSLAGVPPHTTVVRRGIDTLIGGAVALVATLVWPTWEREVVPARLGDLLAAYRAYTGAVADLTWDPPRLQKARSAARLARTNAQASVDRARFEPVPGQAEVELGEAVLAHTHRFVHAMLSIDALRPALREAGGLAEFDELMRRAADALDRCERSVRTGTPPRPVPKLREAQEQLAAVLAEDPGRAGGVETASALLDASDRIANSLDTLVSELRRQLSASAGGLASSE
ncbi:MAG: hypothetical protein JWO57_1203 [Pseudonocardiales bacterium]|nr:hypothetical protein [Pseudonocardiales bacterium]